MQTNSLDVDTTADSMMAAFTSQLGLFPLHVEKRVSSSQIVWDATFDVFDASAATLHVVRSTVAGSSGVQVVTDITPQTPMSGAFVLALQGTQTAPISVSASTQAIADAVNGALPTVSPTRVTKRTIGNRGVEITLTFPDLVGDIPAITIDSSGVQGGSSVTGTVDTVQHGTFAPLQGAFQLAVTNAAAIPVVTSDIPFDAAGSTVQSQVAVLLSLSVASVSRQVENNGYAWYIIMDGVVDTKVLRSLSTVSKLTGTGATVFANVMDVGDDMTVSVSLSSNGIDFSESTLTYTYVSAFEVISASPLVGPTTGGTPVVFQTMATRPTLTSLGKIYCRFGDVIVEGSASASSAATTSFVCKTPRHRPGVVTFLVGLNGVDFDTYVGEFEYERDGSAWLEISPVRGVVDGGTLVYVSGIEFALNREYS